MFINASAKEFTLIHLVTFSILRSRIRWKFYFVCTLINSSTDEMFEYCVRFHVRTLDGKRLDWYMSVHSNCMSCDCSEILLIIA